MSSIDTNIPGIIELPQFLDPRGNLAIIEQCDTIPFAIKRVHWIYDVPGGESREGHAYHSACEFIVALSGSFEIETISGDGVKESFLLTRSYYGLFIPPLCWRTLKNFSTNSLALIISSTPYLPEDYITNYEQFKRIASGTHNGL